MNELNGQIKKEVRIRGQIITLSLNLEDAISKVIYSFFKPDNDCQEALNLYLNEFILPIAFGKKISFYKKLLKTDAFKVRMQKYLDRKHSSTENKDIHTVENLIDYLNRNLSEILKTRNLIAHGINLNALLTDEIDLNEDDFIFANKLKPEIINEQLLKDFSEKTLLTSFMINMIEIHKKSI